MLCDRFTDATWAYQGGGHGVDVSHIAALERWVHDACRPDLTILFDVPPSVSRERLERATASGRTLDKFEREGAAFTGRVRATYLDRARAEPARFRVMFGPRLNYDRRFPSLEAEAQRAFRILLDAIEAGQRDKTLIDGVSRDLANSLWTTAHGFASLVLHRKIIVRSAARAEAYFVEIVSHRHLRYGSGLLHLVVFGTNVALVALRAGLVYDVLLGLQLAFLLVAWLRRGLPRYYALVTWATVVSLWNYLRRGVPATWDAAEGTR